MHPSDSTPDCTARIQEIRSRLTGLDSERRLLEDELRALEDAARGVLPLSVSTPASGPLQPADKVTLFLALFGARRSLFPKFWENPKTGKDMRRPAITSGGAAFARNRGSSARIVLIRNSRRWTKRPWNHTCEARTPSEPTPFVKTIPASFLPRISTGTVGGRTSKPTAKRLRIPISRWRSNARAPAMERMRGFFLPSLFRRSWRGCWARSCSRKRRRRGHR